MHDTHIQPTTGSLIGRGAVAGVIAGLVFAAFEMVASAVMMGADAFFMPLRMIGAIVLGAGALDPGYSLLAAGFAGVVVHVALSIVYGIIFAAAISRWRRGDASTVLLATVYGIALWLVNFYAIAPIAFPWFLESNPVVQFIAHAFFFGTVLGLVVAQRSRAYT